MTAPALLLALALSTQAPPPAPEASPADPGSTVVAELDVVGRPPGPALWRARRGDSQVVILGTVSPLPHSLAWDQARVGRALDGARVLLTPPVAEVGLLDMPSLAVKAIRARTRTPLASRTPPDIYRRVLAAAQVARTPPEKLEGWRAAVTGFILENDFQKAAGLSRAKPASTVVRMAKTRRVPVRAMVRLRGTPLAEALLKMDEARGATCLDGAARDVQWQAAHAVPAARAWAAGHVSEARAEDDRGEFERCVFEAPSTRAMIDRGVADGLAAVEAELGRPGKAVVVVDLKYLAAANGLLDRLKARGAEITTPP